MATVFRVPELRLPIEDLDSIDGEADNEIIAGRWRD